MVKRSRGFGQQHKAPCLLCYAAFFEQDMLGLLADHSPDLITSPTCCYCDLSVSFLCGLQEVATEGVCCISASLKGRKTTLRVWKIKRRQIKVDPFQIQMTQMARRGCFQSLSGLKRIKQMVLCSLRLFHC